MIERFAYLPRPPCLSRGDLYVATRQINAHRNADYVIAGSLLRDVGAFLSDSQHQFYLMLKVCSDGRATAIISNAKSSRSLWPSMLLPSVDPANAPMTPVEA